MFCTECGTQFNPAAKFCMKCGTKNNYGGSPSPETTSFVNTAFVASYPSQSEAATKPPSSTTWPYSSVVSLCIMVFVFSLFPWFTYSETGVPFQVDVWIWEIGGFVPVCRMLLIITTLLFGLYVAGRAPSIGVGRLPVSDGFVGSALAGLLIVFSLSALGGINDNDGFAVPASAAVYFSLLLFIALGTVSIRIITMDTSGEPIIKRGWT